MNGSPVAGLVRGWVRFYTRGLPAEVRGVPQVHARSA